MSDITDDDVEYDDHIVFPPAKIIMRKILISEAEYAELLQARQTIAGLEHIMGKAEAESAEYDRKQKQTIATLTAQLKSARDIPDFMIDHFAEINGAMEVHRSWRDHMLEQSRSVSEERMNWNTLPEQDKALDYLISRDIIRDFVVWLQHEAIVAQEAGK